MMGNKNTAAIQKEFKSLRRKLLDLSMRNQLLKFRPRSRTIEVVEGDLNHIYDFLLLKEKKMQFLPRKEAIEEEKEDEVEIENKSSDLWELPPVEVEITEENKSRFLETDLTPSELQRRLFYINQRARTMLQEQGYNILYLGLGFLEWTEPHEPDVRKAPLILIPVILERRKVGKSFSIHWDGNDILTNISLQAKLKEMDLDLPEFKMPLTPEGVEKYLKKVKKSIKTMKDWQVLEEIQLGFFSFTKFVMYRDLDPASYKEGVDITEKPLIEALFNPDPHKRKSTFQESEVDSKLQYENVYHVMDADSSQIAVIEDVKSGNNLVVEGPPGTGKSQTIVNLIAELMAHGKTVLFVSEKMAALEVVKNRLDGIGLGKFCLELHSHKTRKKDVLQELESSLNESSPEELDIERQLNRLETLRRQLNDYNQGLHQPLYQIRLSPFQLFGMKENAEKHFKNLPLVRIPSPETITPEEWEESIIELENLAKLAQLLPPLSDNTWSGTDPGMILPPDAQGIELLIQETRDLLESLRKKVRAMEDCYGIKPSKNFNEFEKSIQAADVLAQSRPVDLAVLNSTVWDEHENDAFLLLDKLKKLHSTRNILDKFHDSAREKDLDRLLQEYLEQSSSKIKFLSGKYRKIKNEIDSLYLKTPPTNDYEIIQDLESLKDYLNLYNELLSHEVKARKFFGSMWNLENASLTDLTATARWIVLLRKLVQEKIITDKTIELAAQGIEKSKVLSHKKEVLIDADRFSIRLDKLKNRLNTHSHVIFNKEGEYVTYNQWKSKLKDWQENLSILPLWSQYLEKKRLCMKTRAAAFIPSVESGQIKLEDVESAMEGNLADSLLAMAFKELSILYTFIGDLHQGRIKEFQKLDSRIIELNRKRLFHKLNQEMPLVFGGAAPNSQASILSGELTRKRGHLPLRKLLSKAGGLIKQIKPCFMMSPLSIAQYLDPTTSRMQFDVVIFDEASQVKPEDALGAFLRAKTAVVMGDTNQLPPTSFFDQMISSEEETEQIATAADMESILHLCKRSFQVKMLRWHYRSRHESLIAVSNKEFYDNHLLVYPSPCHESKELGLKHEYHPETVYERGKSRSNPLEAKEVVNMIFNHFQEYGDTRSLGVGTFSVAQMNAILEELELKRKENPAMEKYFQEKNKEHFFVKNLETIQGDERDVILISIGYGFDENHKISLNFGPLNQEGGERRLNVLITRAREKCVVFSNFQSMDLHVNSGTPFGVRALKNFLQYAETGTMGRESGKDEYQSTFENSLYQFLVDNELDVERNVGCAGFRVDLAILDEQNPGRYLLGIECDGAMYHSSPVARDRDRLREQILEGLGWKIIHVWSTDWYRNREETQKKILVAIEKIRNDLIKEEVPDIWEDVLGEGEKIEGNGGESLDSDSNGGEVSVNVNQPTKVDYMAEDISTPQDEDLNDKKPITGFNPDAGNDTGDSFDKEPGTGISSDLDDDSTFNPNVDEDPVFTPRIDEVPADAPPRLEDKLIPYQTYDTISLTSGDDLYKSSIPTISSVVSEIVSTEGPIHSEEVIRRIRESCGLRRAGSKVRNIISSGMEMAENNGNIRRSGDFLLLNDTSRIDVRQRKYKVDITYISAEEIREALKMVLEFEKEINKRELIIKTSRLFGFKTTSKKTFDRIENVLEDMLNKGELKNNDGLISF